MSHNVHTQSQKYKSSCELKVDVWKQTHDEENVFNESYDGEHTLKVTSQTKYLGCILSNDGTNNARIKTKVNKSIGTRKTNKDFD